MDELSKAKDVADAAKGIVEAVPIYQDALQPAAREVGKALQTIVKTIHIALAPISALVWGYEHIRDFVSTRVAEKLKNVPPERIATPSPLVVGPALEALKYSGHESTLREMYASLIATSLDSDTALLAHPSFVDIIKSMSPDEARLLKMIYEKNHIPLIDIQRIKDGTAGHAILYPNYSMLRHEDLLEHKDLVPSYLNNLNRLGLIDIPFGTYLTQTGIYEAIETCDEAKEIKKRIEEQGFRINFDRKVAIISSFGTQFAKACIAR